MGLKSSLKKIDSGIEKFMKNWSVPILRFSFAILFIWFGILKPMRLSAAEPLVLATVKWLPVYDPVTWLIIIGWWEVVIGIFFIFKRTTKIAIGLLFLQMVGTFMPLLLLPDVTFQDGLIYQPTLEGQYIIKNFMIISAALVVGGTTYNVTVKT